MHPKEMMGVAIETVSGPLAIFQVYAPDSAKQDEDEEEFLFQLQAKILKIPEHENFWIFC